MLWHQLGYSMAAKLLLIGAMPAMWCGVSRSYGLIPRDNLSGTARFILPSGPRAAIDLSFALIEEDYGGDVALAAAQEFVAPSLNGNGQHKLPSPVVFDSQPADRLRNSSPGLCEI